MPGETSAPKVHLVGSVPLESAEAVFRTVGGTLGDRITRLPDGETGKRIDWIRMIQVMLTEHPDLEIDPDTPPLEWTQWDGVKLRDIPRVKFKDGVDPASVKFDTPYADSAIQSFALFDKLQQEGAIAAGVKFQVSIATPLAPTYNYVVPRAKNDFLPVFTAYLLGEVARMLAALPAERIAVQWDVCQEVLMWEGYYDFRPDDYKDEIIGSLAEVGDAIPEPVELGYHLCYGSPRDEHLMQPKDAGAMVEMVNALAARVKRSIQFVHLPVPKDRTDDAFYAPLADLKLGPETELLLGLVHYDDDAGNAERLAQARKYVRVDGVGDECGWGRKNPERIPRLLDGHCRLVDAG